MTPRWATAFLLFAAGCQSTTLRQPTSTAPGFATLHVRVIAEPKQGSPQANATLSTFDTPKSPNTGEFTKVDYADLSQIVISAEQVRGLPTQLPGLDPLHLQLRNGLPPDSVSAAATIGQPILLENDTGKSQTIYSVSDGNEFNLGEIAPGASARAEIHAAGAIEILGDFTQPLAVIEAVKTPWVKLAHAGDDLIFYNLAPGTYRVVSWHPRLPGSETSVQLNPDQTASLDIRVGVNALPKVEPEQTR